jgi:hypothetical protein
MISLNLGAVRLCANEIFYLKKFIWPACYKTFSQYWGRNLSYNLCFIPIFLGYLIYSEIRQLARV